MKNRIRVLRDERRWSQKELAQRLDVTRQTIYSLERGVYLPRLPLAFQIAEVFGTTVEEVFQP